MTDQIGHSKQQTFGASLLEPQARALGLSYEPGDPACWTGCVRRADQELAHIGPVLDINRHVAAVRARKKSAASMILRNAGIFVPDQRVLSRDLPPEIRAAALADLLEEWGEVVLKPEQGTKGRNVRLLTERNAIEAALEEMPDDTLVAERRIEGQEARVIVFRGRPIGGYWRKTGWARDGALQADTPEEFLDDVPRRIAPAARAAAHELGLDLAGLDLVAEEGTGRVIVLEANAAPNYGAACASPRGRAWSERIVREILRRRFRT